MIILIQSHSSIEEDLCACDDDQGIRVLSLSFDKNLGASGDDQGIEVFSLSLPLSLHIDVVWMLHVVQSH